MEPFFRKKMNTFQIQIQESISEGGTKYDEVRLFIDGRDLIDMLKEFERPFAEREGSPDIAGAYSGLPAKYASGEYLLGMKKSIYGENRDKISLLECTCGCGGCWPFAAKVTVLENSVIWSDFEQPHRTIKSAAALWDYSEFGPFEFARKEYEQELSKLNAT